MTLVFIINDCERWTIWLRVFLYGGAGAGGGET